MKRESNSLSLAGGNQRRWELVPRWAVERTQGPIALVLIFNSTDICGVPGTAEATLGASPTSEVKMNTHPGNQTATKSRMQMRQMKAPKQTGTDGKVFWSKTLG